MSQQPPEQPKKGGPSKGGKPAESSTPAASLAPPKNEAKRPSADQQQPQKSQHKKKKTKKSKKEVTIPSADQEQPKPPKEETRPTADQQQQQHKASKDAEQLQQRRYSPPKPLPQIPQKTRGRLSPAHLGSRSAVRNEGGGRTLGMSRYSLYEAERKKGLIRKTPQLLSVPSSHAHIDDLQDSKSEHKFLGKVKNAIVGKKRETSLVPGFYVKSNPGGKEELSTTLPELGSEVSHSHINFRDAERRWKKRRARASVTFNDEVLMRDAGGSSMLDMQAGALFKLHPDDETETVMDDLLRTLSPLDLTDSLEHLRRKPSMRNEESVEEYDRHRRNFWLIFSVYVMLSIMLISFTLVFIFEYNYGFYQFSTEDSSMDTPKIRLHEGIRVRLNAHALIMILGASLLSSFGVLLYRIFPNISRMRMKWVHGSNQTLSCCFFSGGIYMAWNYKEFSNGSHFFSVHSYLAGLTFVVRVVTELSGFVYIMPFCSWDTRVTLIPFHRYMGNLLVLSEMCVVVTGVLQFTWRFFDAINFPEFYPHEYHELDKRAIFLNMIPVWTIGCMIILPNTILGHYHFRRRRRPALTGTADSDIEIINKVKSDSRKSAALLREAAEKPKTDIEGQFGSRKTFNAEKKKKLNIKRAPENPASNKRVEKNKPQ